MNSRWDRGSALGRCGWVLVVGLLMSGGVLADIQWKSGSVSASRRMSTGEIQAELGRIAQTDTAARRVLVFDGPLTEADRRSLDEQGVHLLNYLGGFGYFARIEGDVDPARAASFPGLIEVQAISNAHKLHPDLARGVVHPWQIVREEGQVDPTETKFEPGDDPIVAIHVLFYRDIDLNRDAREIVGRYGGKVHSFVHSINAVVAHIRASSVVSLAADERVMFIEPPLPMLTEVNDSSRARTEAETLQDPPFDLDGSGVTVLVFDGGQMFQHGDFAGRLTVGASDTSGISDHATHVGGTIGGSGAGSAGVNRGMAPAVDLISFGFEQEGGLSAGFLYTDPGDLEADYTEAIGTYGAEISNNSIGTNTAPNGYPCEWEGDYGATGALIDAIVRGSLGAPFRIVWANGNERGSGRCGATYLTTAPPACAKNHITVGAMNSNDDSVTSFTSWGPTDDGRIKPDISAPGCESGGDGGVTSTSSSGGYNVKCGTSMASPATTGIAALMLQQYRQSFPATPDPRNSTLKSILANSAAEVAAIGPDYQSGYGSIRGVAAIDTITQGRFIEAGVAQGETYAFIVVVNPGDPQLKVTIAWDDAPGTPNVNPVLVNDLDLRVVDSGGGIYLPWTLDPANPANPAVRTQRDGVNNIEQVTIDNPAPGAYRVEVTGFNIADGPTQIFSAAASPSLINCSSAGIVSTSASRIACDASFAVSVIDCDLNTDDGLTETTTVSVVSTSEPAGETLLLTESAPESAAFENSISVNSIDAPGVLQVSEGDNVTVTYLDADDGDGGTNLPRTRILAVDCSAPVIQSVTATNVGAREATATIAIDEPVGATVHFGTSCGNLDSTRSKGGLLTTQAVKLTGLEPNTTYYFDVLVQDEAGNSAADDNQGNCYSFTTPDIPDFLTEQFTTGADLAGTSISFTPDGSIDFYTFCATPLAGSLPTDPTGGTDLALSDDIAASFTLTGGETVSIYGQPFDTIWVGPNGFLTFGSGDNTYTESLTQHFSVPRISAMFDDLNPNSAGTVSYLQFSDRVVVSWEGVPEYSTSNSNTFQIEVFFSGEIRIHWLEIASADFIAGLSAGTGLDPDFAPTDLSADGACGPTPPVALPMTLQTDINVPLPVAFNATDDGNPLPSALYFRVMSLPGAGTLIDDATSSPITVAPHTVAGGVTYVPALDFAGVDGFGFIGHDGGLAPEGGASAVAAVSITVQGTSSAVYEFLVDDTDPGWSGTGLWAFGSPVGGGSGAGDPVAGATGANVLGYNLIGDYTNSMAPEALTSDPLDLTQATGAAVEFQRRLGVDASPADNAAFQVSVDGTNWITVWDHNGTVIDESDWSLQTYDISAVADGQPAVSLRWVMGGSDASVTYPGWNLDDIRVMTTSNGQGQDCDPGNPDVWRVPTELLNLQVDRAAATTILWNGQDLLAGPGTVYELTSGDLGVAGVDLTSPACLQSGTSAGHTELRAEPAPGTGFWYLGRAWNSCGGSTFGNGGRDGWMPDANSNGVTDVCE